MKKILFAIVAVASLSACGQAKRMEAHYTGYSEICVDGVSYIQFPSGATVKVGRDGKPIPC